MTNDTKTEALVYGALCIALSFALSYVKLFSMPVGGSVTLCSMLPLMVYSYRFGLPKGLLAGLAYGLMQLLQKPEIIHWAQLLLDYPLAFTAVALAGVTACRGDVTKDAVWRLPLGVLIGGIARAICHIVSGAVFFGEYAPAGTSAWLYSLLYNGGYLGMDTLLCMVVAAIPPVRKTLLRV